MRHTITILFACLIALHCLAQNSFYLNDIDSIIESMSVKGIPDYANQKTGNLFYSLPADNQVSSYNSYEFPESSERKSILEIDNMFSGDHRVISGNQITELSDGDDLSMMISTIQSLNGDSGHFDFDEAFPETGFTDSDMVNMIASVTGNMSIDGTLDFIDNAYNPSVTNPEANIPVTSLGKFKGISGSATLPIMGMITSRFGFRPKYGKMHKGIDIALNVGDTVKCAIDGIVSRVAWDQNGYGLFIVVKHSNDIETRYAHLNSALVAPGEFVLAGSPIALGGNTGNSTGPHLHFETLLQGQALDPSLLFDFSTGESYNNSDLFMVDEEAIAEQLASAAYSYERSTYVVKVGDNVEKIAKKNRISVYNLCRLNNIRATSDLEPGRMLKLR